MANRENEEREKQRSPRGFIYYQPSISDPRIYSAEPPPGQIPEEFSGGKEPAPLSGSEAKLEILVTLTTSLVAVVGAVLILWGLATLSYFSSFPQFETLQLGAVEMAVFGLILFSSFGFITMARVQRIRKWRALNKAEHTRYRAH